MDSAEWRENEARTKTLDFAVDHLGKFIQNSTG